MPPAPTLPASASVAVGAAVAIARCPPSAATAATVAAAAALRSRCAMSMLPSPPLFSASTGQPASTVVSASTITTTAPAAASLNVTNLASSLPPTPSAGPPSPHASAASLQQAPWAVRHNRPRQVDSNQLPNQFLGLATPLPSNTFQLPAIGSQTPTPAPKTNTPPRQTSGRDTPNEQPPKQDQRHGRSQQRERRPSQAQRETIEQLRTENQPAPSLAETAARGLRANSVVERYAERDPRPISLRQLTSLGRSLNRDKVLVSANFVREELLVRLARRIQDFQQLPFIVGTNPHIAHVYGLYWDAFDALLAVPAVATLDANAALCDLLSALLDSHMPVIPHLAIGLSEIPASHFSAEDVDRFMGAMVFSRIGRRVLGEHHLALTANFTRTWREQQAKHHGASGGDRSAPLHDFPRDSRIHSTLFHHSHATTQHSSAHVGIVNLRCRADRLVEHCSTMASAWFSETFSSTGIAPPRVVVDGHLHALIACIPSHAEYVLYELLKNSMAHTFKNAAPEAYARWRERRLEGQRELLNKVGPASGVEGFGRFTWNEPRAAWVPEDPSPLSPLAGSPGSTGARSETSNSTPPEPESDEAVLPEVRVTIGYLPSGHTRPGSSSKSEPHPPELTFRVSDTGGGIPNSVLAPSATSSDADTATLLRWSTALARRRRRTDFNSRDSEFTDGAVVPNEEEGHEWRPWKRDIHLRMHHLGLALPMAASFARYWGGGGLALHSMHGYGTDAYFRVPAGEGIEEDVVGWENKL